ncbi:hypothetical protein H0H93_005417, partial [Arthromyces matolae]
PKGILGKIGEVAGSVSNATPAPAPKGILGKIGEVAGSVSNATPAQAPTGILGKIGEVAGSVSNATPAPAPKGILGKIGEVAGNVTKDKTASTPLSGKFGGILGKSNQDEDMLDKAIDLVQEYILREGPQDNETPLEKIKDKAIATAIRHQFKTVTGVELPSVKLPGQGSGGK